jgi:mannose-6-phosphate isomerase-like protein (cupin superfamily)
MSMSRDGATPSGCAVVVLCADLSAALELLVDRLGFAVELIMPADSPRIVEVSGYGVRLRLEQRPPDEPARTVTVRLSRDALGPERSDIRSVHALDGLRIEIVAASAEVPVPPGEQRFILTRHGGEDSWGVGRAGMLYRDLIPDRLGGRFVASHIRIPVGGPVPDYVHFHRIRFQMIYCRAGRARLVYEDQGEPFDFDAGDCVLQPPEIRHRVLETSDGFEVVEIGCPAVHETRSDRRMSLPTDRLRPQRDFRGQKFVRHVARDAAWTRWHHSAGEDGFQVRDTGIAAATQGLAGVSVIRSTREGSRSAAIVHEGEFLFWFVLHGRMKIESDRIGAHDLRECDSTVIPAGAEVTVIAGPGLELLQVALPAP